MTDQISLYRRILCPLCIDSAIHLETEIRNETEFSFDVYKTEESIVHQNWKMYTSDLIAVYKCLLMTLSKRKRR